MADETTPRWSTDQVLALAPDVASQRAGRGLATPTRWRETGTDPPGLWGRCAGSGPTPYQVVVELTGPAVHCTCPSRKTPCKHALALLLLWSGGQVAAGKPPGWAAEWLDQQAVRGDRAAARAAAAADRAGEQTGQTDDAAASKSRQRRMARVEAGLDELDRWLADQIRQGIAGATRAGYEHWDTMAARLVDAQAQALASAVRRLAAVAADPDRLLTELALLRLLVDGYRRIYQLPADLAATVRSRVGFPVPTAEVLAQPGVRDRWAVVGVQEQYEEWLTVRRVWLHGAGTGRSALSLSFAPAGQPLAADLLLGTVVDADLCFYPGALPLRAIVATQHSPAEPFREPPGTVDVATALDRYAAAVAAEPWLTRWPMLLAGVVPVADPAGRWHVRDHTGAGLPIDPVISAPWPLVAACGGAPVSLAAEWSPAGLRPLTAWAEGRLVRL
ncbi:MAG TPA: SWIM zinc finger family protein [Micromonosporaceae bacterium]